MEQEEEIKIVLHYLKDNNLLKTYTNLKNSTKINLYPPIIESLSNALDKADFKKIKTSASSQIVQPHIKTTILELSTILEFLLFMFNQQICNSENTTSAIKTYNKKYRVFSNSIFNLTTIKDNLKTELILFVFYSNRKKMDVLSKILETETSSIEYSSTNLIKLFKHKILSNFDEYNIFNKINLSSLLNSKIKNSLITKKLRLSDLYPKKVNIKLIKTLKTFSGDVDYILVSQRYNELLILSKKQGLQKINLDNIENKNDPILETAFAEPEEALDNLLEGKPTDNNFLTLALSENEDFIALEGAKRSLYLLNRNKEKGLNFCFKSNNVAAYCFIEDCFLECSLTGIYTVKRTIDKKEFKINNSKILKDCIEVTPISLKYFPELKKLCVLNVNSNIIIFEVKIYGEEIEFILKEKINTKLTGTNLGEFQILNGDIVLLTNPKKLVRDNENQRFLFLVLYGVKERKILVEYNKFTIPIRVFLYPAITKGGRDYVANGFYNGEIILFDKNNGDKLKIWKAHSCIVNCVKFYETKDKTFVISASDDRTVKIWEVA